MATFRKRNGKYHVQVRLKGFEPATASFDRLTDAKEWAAKTETHLRAGRYFGKSKCHTFNKLADEYLSQAKDIKRLEYWRSVFGNLRLADITSERINKEIKKLLSEETARFATPAIGIPKIDAERVRAKRSGATVNRYFAALSSCLSYGERLEWVERNPCKRVTKPKENEGRLRFLSDKERPRLLEACRKHQDLYLAVVLSLTTGARQGEIMNLRWGQIDFKRKVITLEKTKNGDKRVLGVVGEAFVLLQNRSKVRNMTDDRVFPPTERAKKADYLDLRQPWEAALKEADVTNFHWHDLRHTAASYLAMSGVSLVEIAKVLGHRTLAMVARYAHLSDDHIVATGEKLATRLGIGK
ncbi:MAG: tyrosine-type recombinase/integrase [Nitrosomonadaceae bacterium]